MIIQCKGVGLRERLVLRQSGRRRERHWALDGSEVFKKSAARHLRGRTTETLFPLGLLPRARRASKIN